MVLAMIALTVFVVAMIASYSGAFARPTLHHLTVAVAAPEQVVDAIRRPGCIGGQQGWRRRRRAATGARTQGRLRLRRHPRRRDEDLRRRRRRPQRGHRRRNRRPRDREHEAGLTATVEDVAPTSAADPSGTVEFYAIIFISIGASLGATAFGYIMGKVRKPMRFLLRTLTLAGYSAVAGRCGDGLRRRHARRTRRATHGPSSVRCGSTRWPSRARSPVWRRRSDPWPRWC